ncbi:MAG: ferredoxin [Proteobacteria bacterium]|nr:ferredoxin [Pseudomonadota bacterium]
MLQPAAQQTSAQQSPSDEASTLHEVLVDPSECNACSGCCDICPEIFEWDDDLGRPSLKRQFATHDEVREAISLCPRRCITAEGWTEEFY